MMRRLLLLPGLLAALAVGGVALAGASGTGPACPAADRHTVLSARPGATRELVPPGARAVLLCRYSGMYRGIGPRAPAFLLQGHDLIDGAATLASMTRRIDSLPRITTPIACPAGFGTAIVARFRYAAGPDDPVTIALDGCLDASNGHVSRVGLSASWYAFVKHLAALTGLRLGA
jgi:hypothetical protein